MSLFLPLVKADQVNHLVYARAAAEELDKSREIMDYASAVPAFQTWSQGFSDVTMGKSLGNVRAMHNPKHLSGVVKTLNFDDATKGVDVCIKVLDPVDWDKIEHGGYTGISIGGGYAKKWPDPLDKSVTRYTPRLQEISFVDSPCIPSARIMEMQKSDGTTEEVLLKGVPRTFADLRPPRTFAEMEKGLFMAGLGGIAGHYIGKKIGQKMFGGAVRQLGMAAARNGSRITVDEHLGNVAMAGKIGRKVGAGVGAITGIAAGLNLGRRRKKDPAALKQEILDNLNKAGLGGAVSYLSRGKMFTSAPIEEGASFIGRHGKKVVVSATSDPVSYTSRGKTFTGKGGATTKFTKQDILDTLAKASAEEGDLGKASAEARAKISATLHEFKTGKLRSFRGTDDKGKARKGPKVTDRKQAIAIALSQARRMGKMDDSLLVAALTDRLEKQAA